MRNFLNGLACFITGLAIGISACTLLAQAPPARTVTSAELTSIWSGDVYGVLTLSQPARDLVFPCPPTIHASGYSFGCTDPLAAGKMILRGPWEAWRDFKVCREVRGRERCARLGDLRGLR